MGGFLFCAQEAGKLLCLREDENAGAMSRSDGEAGSRPSKARAVTESTEKTKPLHMQGLLFGHGTTS